MGDLTSKINYTFKNERIFIEALTHSSAASAFNRNKPDDGDRVPFNERLEFLGDSVLSLVLSDFLISRSEKYSEGKLSKIRAALVSEGALAAISKSIGLDTCIIMSQGEEKGGGRNKDSVLADAFEALLGAIYLDGGYEYVKRTVLEIYTEKLTEPLERFIEADYKSKLQEITQGTFKSSPTYEVIKREGPDHNLKFEVEVSFNDVVLGRGIGVSKKKASQKAAMSAIANLKTHPDFLSEQK
ncbi:MAG: ribonuclease III [Oligoflexales bacterium]|nr:ribonuclease III [Oligoflexales bacterium]